MLQAEKFTIAYIDENDKDKCDDKKMHLDWFYELPEGNRIFASAFSAAGNIYFGTSTAETEDPCSALETGANEGSIYAFKMDGGLGISVLTYGVVILAAPDRVQPF